MHKASWWVFILALLGGTFFVLHTAARLPVLVPSHWDLAGYPSAFMTRDNYIRFALLLVAGLPIALVALLTIVYTRSDDMKLPNRDYWLAPERIARTRALLVAHGVWFGTLLIAMFCYMHWLELDALRRIPPQLSNAPVQAGLLAFFLIATGLIIALLMAFRRPRGG